MKRFLMLVGVAVVVAVMYAAAAAGSQQAKGPTAKQFKALKKQVAALSQTMKAVKAVAGVELALIGACDLSAVPINQFGDPQNHTVGYRFASATNLASPALDTLTTALDVTSQTDGHALWITGGDSSCGTLINGSSGLRHVAAKAGIELPHAASHIPSFVVHQR